MLKSAVKSLTDQEYADFRAGKEMGFARVAKLNGYPSPLEVNQLGKELKLSTSQKAQLEKIIDAWRFKAKEMGGFIVAQEAKLNTLFASGKISDGAVIYYTNKIGLYWGEVRNAHLQAYLKTRSVLTAEQLRKYNRLKGYIK
ncbi:MAG TPA: hypothetical protein VGE26_08570 [Sphingobacteriaceae bacterium]